MNNKLKFNQKRKMYSRSFIAEYCLILLLFLTSSVYGQNITPSDQAAVQPDGSPEKLNWEGISLGKKGKYAEAIRKFQKALEIEDASAARTYNNLGFIYELSGDNVKAIESYEKAILRNPNQITTLQNLGKLLYFGGRYKESIEYGEKVAKLEPGNKEIHKWLPDAYKKAAEQRLFALKKMQFENEQKKDLADFKKDQNGAADAEKINVETPATIREYKFEFGYFLNNVHFYAKDRKKMLLQKKYGITYFPMGLWMNIHPSPDLKIRGGIETPHFGLFSPKMLSGEEKLEFLYMLPNSYYGVGLFFSQYDLQKDKLPTGTKAEIIQNDLFSRGSDFKIGFIYGAKSYKYDLELYGYPRYMFSDRKNEPYGVSVDRSVLGLKFKTILTTADDISKLKEMMFLPHFVFEMMSNEIFITEYPSDTDGAVLGHYMGYYEVTFGVELGKLYPAYDKVPFIIGFTFTERLYFQKFDGESPFKFGNGMGWLGFDTKSALEGNTFPTFNINSHLFTLYFEELFQNRLIFKQKFTYEFNGNRNINALFMRVDIGMRI